VIALREDFDSKFPAEIRAMFGKKGVLSGAKGFEFRAEQQQMAVAVAAALAENRHLVVEAGTGVGKSLAYLVPAVLCALRDKRKAIISTHTINLQEQLLHKDIPIVRRSHAAERKTKLFVSKSVGSCFAVAGRPLYRFAAARIA
jgi:ATP-dependent DNA helicase DinG